MHASRSSYSSRGGSQAPSPANSAAPGASSARFRARTDENRVPTYMRPTTASSRAAVTKDSPQASTARSRIGTSFGAGAGGGGRFGLREQTPNGSNGLASTTPAASRAQAAAPTAGSSASRFSYRSTTGTTNASGTRSAFASNGASSFRPTPMRTSPAYPSYTGAGRGAAATTAATRTPFTSTALAGSTLRPRPAPYSSSRLASASSARTSQASARSDEDMDVDEEGTAPPPAPQLASQLQIQQQHHQQAQPQPQVQPGQQQQHAQQQHLSQQRPNKVWTIADFEIGREIGKGKFGKVYIARERGTRVKVAIKVVIKDVLRAEGVAHQLKKEVEIHSRIRHPNILPLYATFQDATRVFLVMRYAGGGDLYKKLQSTAGHRFPEREAMQYVAQLVSALEACHQQHVVHRDIKPENLLLSEDGSLQLGDFGWSSANVTPANRRETLCGTLDYLSPEMICGEKYDESVDIWAVGVIMYEMLVGKPPFEAPGQGETMDRITNEPVRVPPYVSPAARDLITKILRKRPEDRLKLPEIKAHRWFSPVSTRQRSARRAL